MLIRYFFTCEKNRTANENAYSLLHSENTIFFTRLPRVNLYCEVMLVFTNDFFVFKMIKMTSCPLKQLKRL